MVSLASEFIDVTISDNSGNAGGAGVRGFYRLGVKRFSNGTIFREIVFFFRIGRRRHSIREYECKDRTRRWNEITASYLMEPDSEFWFL